MQDCVLTDDQHTSLRSTVAGTANHNIGVTDVPVLAGSCDRELGMKKRTARITVETERLLVIRRSQTSCEGWCNQCEARVKLIGLEEAAGNRRRQPTRNFSLDRSRRDSLHRNRRRKSPVLPHFDFAGMEL